jgi:pyruvate/2-oxoglutarate dehydrogenase complex dihydrolipoamide acyltransferase (E2) component
MEVESEVGGVLLKKIHAEGDVVPVTTVLGYFGGRHGGA